MVISRACACCRTQGEDACGSRHKSKPQIGHQAFVPGDPHGLQGHRLAAAQYKVLLNELLQLESGVLAVFLGKGIADSEKRLNLQDVGIGWARLASYSRSSSLALCKHTEDPDTPYIRRDRVAAKMLCKCSGSMRSS